MSDEMQIGKIVPLGDDSESRRGGFRDARGILKLNAGESSEQLIRAMRGDCDEKDARILELERELAEAKDTLAEMNRWHMAVMNEECPTDEIHCTCVPMLRAQNKHLESDLAAAREEIERQQTINKTIARDVQAGAEAGYRQVIDTLKAGRDAARKDAEELAKALQRIEKWFGEFPRTGHFHPDGTEQSYGWCYGSNGERDYMRGIARQAIESSGARYLPVLPARAGGRG